MHADGQKIAKRLSIGITKETGNVRNLLSDYNTTSSLVGNSITVPLAEVLSPDADFWQNRVPHALSTSLSHDMSWNIKKDIAQAYLLIQRCEEELVLLAEEKQNVLTYWSYQKESIQKQLATLSNPSTLHAMGSRALLQKYLCKVDLMYSTALASFSAVDDVATANENWSPYDSDLDSLSDCEGV